MLQTSPMVILYRGSATNIYSNKFIKSLENFGSAGFFTLAFIYASFSPGLKGDLKYINVYIIQARDQISTFSVIGNPENRSSCSGAL